MASNQNSHTVTPTIVAAGSLNLRQRKDIQRLQTRCFPHVGEDEAEADFYHPESAHVLAYAENQLVGWAGIHLADTTFAHNKIILGGYGICTHPDFRRQGIASQLSQASLNYLTQQHCDIAFVSVDQTDRASVALHQKHGFIPLQQKFSWINSTGERKSDSGGMIKPLNSSAICNTILNSKETVHVGEGYW